MKKMLMKFGFQTMLAVFFMLGGLLLSSSAQAQGSGWKSNAEAELILKGQVASYHQVLDANTPGSPAYVAAYQHAAYYKGIVRLMYAGENVALATEKALSEVTNAMNESNTNSANAPAVDRTLLNALYAEAKDLLTD